MYDISPDSFAIQLTRTRERMEPLLTAATAKYSAESPITIGLQAVYVDTCRIEQMCLADSATIHKSRKNVPPGKLA